MNHIIETQWMGKMQFNALISGHTVTMDRIERGGGFIHTKWKFKLGKASPWLASFVAVLLILRGLNLGIPYISPQVTHTHSGEMKMECCVKNNSQ